MKAAKKKDGYFLIKRKMALTSNPVTMNNGLVS